MHTDITLDKFKPVAFVMEADSPVQGSLNAAIESNFDRQFLLLLWGLAKL